MPPVSPMLATSVPEVPEVPTGPAAAAGTEGGTDATGPGLLYEPKWDGFRCIVFRDGDEVVLGSRNERPLTRYFPEVVAGVLAETPRRCVLDGEIVLPRGGVLDFDALSQRIHPADSRVRMLARTTPATFVAFDLLALDDDDLTQLSFGQRRAALEQALADSGPTVLVTPATSDPAAARRWFALFEGAGLDGVVAKRTDAPYRPGERVMFKVKHDRTADCVVAGYRMHKSGDGVGSLLLGLYDDSGTLHHVGVTAAFTATRRRELLAELEPLRANALQNHPWREWAQQATAAEGVPGTRGPATRMPGAPSRWSGGKDLSWEPLRLERVVEVAYDHMQGDRVRHTTRLRRWRADRDPASCTYAQLDRPVRFDLAAVLAGS